MTTLARANDFYVVVVLNNKYDELTQIVVSEIIIKKMCHNLLLR